MSLVELPDSGVLFQFVPDSILEEKGFGCKWNEAVEAEVMICFGLEAVATILLFEAGPKDQPKAPR